MTNKQKYHFHKTNPTDSFWWAFTGEYGPLYITFDKKKIYNLWTDYPDKLSATERAIFDAEEPFWRDFFASKK